jgi:hypothetical protein
MTPDVEESVEPSAEEPPTEEPTGQELAAREAPAEGAAEARLPPADGAGGRNDADACEGHRRGRR